MTIQHFIQSRELSVNLWGMDSFHCSTMGSPYWLCYFKCEIIAAKCMAKRSIVFALILLCFTDIFLPQEVSVSGL